MRRFRRCGCFVVLVVFFVAAEGDSPPMRPNKKRHRPTGRDVPGPHARGGIGLSRRARDALRLWDPRRSREVRRCGGIGPRNRPVVFGCAYRAARRTSAMPRWDWMTAESWLDGLCLRLCAGSRSKLVPVFPGCQEDAHRFARSGGHHAVRQRPVATEFVRENQDDPPLGP